ncbi:protein inscuteable homolog isoform X2 [Protopterus annectens]|uniref:protein inscuteable homolog isoform X2 n=1 Tax=Protopterus annectens TaxID=7888 RepID=UPI001CFAEF9E|nr:protein inscuteable homolog isoform X2 [Protopterus annectens]
MKTEIEMAYQGGSHLNSLAISVQRMHLMQVDSVQRWMEDLRLMTECECMCILQSKPISIDDDLNSDILLPPHQTVRDNLQALLKRAWIISTELTKILQKLENNRWQKVHSTAYEKPLMEKCAELTTMTERCTHINEEQTLSTMKASISETLSCVGQLFSQMIELALSQEIQALVRETDTSDNIYSIGAAMSGLFSLTQEGPHLCHIIAKEGGVVSLFKICRQDRFRCLYAPALRTLASICCVEEGINQLEKVDGILCLTDILTDETNSESSRAEAAAVVAQITSPHVTCTQHLGSFLENMEEILAALSKLCQFASSGEVFLLASAALANITFFDTMACEVLLQLNAAQILINACHDRMRVDTPYSKDQVVTILANMAVVDQCASEIIQENGLQLLLEMLFEKPSYRSPAEEAACERVQQKAAVTLARLSRNEDIAQAAVNLQCIPRLIELCKSPTERNNSDSVLVACLAALRRIAATCPDCIGDSDYQRLIKPRLVDSFLLCTNMEESFV